MNLWIPSFLNNLISSTMDNSKTEVGAEATQESNAKKGLEAASDKLLNSVVDEVSEIKDNSTEATEKIHNTTLEATNSAATGIKETLNLNTVVETTKKTTSFSTTPLAKESSLISVESDTDSFKDLGLGGGDIGIAGNDPFAEKNSSVLGKVILRITAIALKDLEKHVNFEECRLARSKQQRIDVDWDDPECQSAVLRLVLVIEAVLLQGRCAYRKVVDHDQSDNGFESGEERNKPPLVQASFLQLLMEMTSDMDEFEKHVEEQNAQEKLQLTDEDSIFDFEPESVDVSTLRTLISTWMHTGTLSRAVSLIIKGFKSVFAPFYDNDAFLSDQSNANSFSNQIKVLDGVDIMVETIAVLGSQGLDLEAEAHLVPGMISTDASQPQTNRAEHGTPKATRSVVLRSSFSARSKEDQVGTSHDLMGSFGSAATRRYVDFHKNAAFASSLRSERDRRMRSWETLRADETIQIVHRKSASQDDIELHKELHNLSRIFYNGTNVMTIRDAARKNDNDNGTSDKKSTEYEHEKVSLLTVEMVSNRRRIEVPDDDSSFLLRAQVRQGYFICLIRIFRLTHSLAVPVACS